MRLPSIRSGLKLLSTVYGPSGLNVVGGTIKFLTFMKEYRTYTSLDDGSKYRTSFSLWDPQLKDKVAHTPVEPTYFFQDAWAAGILFRVKPAHHYDVGSSVKTMSIISQFVPTTMVDIRPLRLQLENLDFKCGSILSLPFEDNSIETLSSLCVVEHVGLGRYGDPIDPFGSEKAIGELKRVLKPGGLLLFSVPVDRENRVYFNAHRSFTREYVLELFNGMELVEERYIYGETLCLSYERSRGFGTGLYCFRKEKI